MRKRNYSALASYIRCMAHTRELCFIVFPFPRKFSLAGYPAISPIRSNFNDWTVAHICIGTQSITHAHTHTHEWFVLFSIQTHKKKRRSLLYAVAVVALYVHAPENSPKKWKLYGVLFTLSEQFESVYSRCSTLLLCESRCAGLHYDHNTEHNCKLYIINAR